MKKISWEGLKVIIAGIIIAFAFLICVLVGIMVSDPIFEFESNIIAIQCCNGTYCTDTYYTPGDNLCHLALCEHLYGRNHPKCVYEGANKSIDLINKQKAR